MKKIFLILAVVFCLGITAYKTFFYLDHRAEAAAVQSNSAVTRLTQNNLDSLREGDIILRRGFGMFSDAISKSLHNRAPVDVTHAGIIVNHHGTWQVIHALSSDVTKIDGVQLQPLDTFLRYSAPGKIIITRAKHADVALGKKIAARAEVYLKKKVPFDHSGVIDNDEKLFCTEMIWKILEKDLHCVTLPQGYEARKDFFYSIGNMYDTRYFDIIINQYMDRPLLQK